MLKCALPRSLLWGSLLCKEEEVCSSLLCKDAEVRSAKKRKCALQRKEILLCQEDPLLTQDDSNLIQYCLNNEASTPALPNRATFLPGIEAVPTPLFSVILERMSSPRLPTLCWRWPAERSAGRPRCAPSSGRIRKPAARRRRSLGPACGPRWRAWWRRAARR